MAITPVQGATGTGGPAATTVNVSWPGPTTAHNYLAAVLCGNGGDPGAITPPDLYLQRGTTKINGATGIWVAVFEEVDCAVYSGSKTFTVTNSQNLLEVNVEEYSGVATSSATDVSNVTNSGTSGTLTTGNVTTTNANDLVLAGFSDGDGSHSTNVAFTTPVPSPSTIRQQQGVNDAGTTSNLRGGLTDNIVSATGSYNMGVSNSNTGRNWASIGWAVKQAAAVVYPPVQEARGGPPLRAPWQPAPYVEPAGAPPAPPRPAPFLNPEIRQGPPQRGAPWVNVLRIEIAPLPPPPPLRAPPIAPEIVSGPPLRGAPFSARLRIENFPGPPAPEIPAPTPAMYAAPRRRQIRPFTGSLRPQPPFALNTQSPQAAGLVSWWPMVGTSANASVDGTALDYGPRAHDLTVKNASLDTALDLGIVYQNADGIQRYLTAPNTADFQITGQVTVAAWVLPFATQPDAYTKILTKGQNKTYTLFLRDNTNPWPAFQITQGGINAYLVAGSGNYIDTLWHHIVGTYDGAQMRLYVDGLLVASVAASGAVDSTTDDLFVGADNTVTINLLANVLKGYVGDVRLYNVGKTDREVWQMFDPRTRWDLYRPSRTKSFTFSAAVSATVQAYAPEIVSGPPLRGTPFSARLRIENPPTPKGLPGPVPLTGGSAPEIEIGPPLKGAPWFKVQPAAPTGSPPLVPPLTRPPPSYPEVNQGPPMRGSPFFRLPMPEFSLPPPKPPGPPGVPSPVQEITGGPPLRGAPWLQHLPVETQQRSILPLGPPPRPPGIRDTRAKPFIERVPGLEGNRRLERLTEQVSTYFNSMLAQGYLRLVAPGQVQILTGALTGHGPPTSATDVSVGAVPGCPYLDLTNTVVYFCFSNASNAAVWRGPF